MVEADNAKPAFFLAALFACRDRLRAFIRRRSAVLEDTDDILQEITMQLMAVQQPVENVSAWLFRAARNEMTDRARKKRDVLFTDVFDEDDLADPLKAVLFGVAQTPEDAGLRVLFWDELARALADMPPAQREVFEKTELEDYSFKRLAQETGLPVQTLLSRKHKAVRFLRVRLAWLYDDIMLP
ncbi:RNA polymerase sigma factor [Martelella alba]|uniref:RNA polymerase sigma factor n=1 Tax=Martelella alba TaxID=2590451 RepID=A0ABY2SMD2_9HYPH|nr:RNA polymerase sigma factor [Martelella alba]TKI05523.1 RNA polymerase sigma factor [Martelella alba]